jgi:hypothetical protein
MFELFRNLGNFPALPGRSMLRPYNLRPFAFFAAKSFFACG